ncbi:hypothetical protein KCP70_02100 [Salmonella enterica subsp. enterica]|nr:hypothetical protein KCP70_02100 [Salmonella enterica subsp. enterica]
MLYKVSTRSTGHQLRRWRKLRPRGFRKRTVMLVAGRRSGAQYRQPAAAYPAFAIAFSAAGKWGFMFLLPPLM